MLTDSGHSDYAVLFPLTKFWIDNRLVQSALRITVFQTYLRFTLRSPKVGSGTAVACIMSTITMNGIAAFSSMNNIVSAVSGELVVMFGAD